MRILLVSIKSIHFRRWTEQLEHSGHEVYYFDISGKKGILGGMSWLHQKQSWKYRWDFPGRYALKNHFPRIYKWIQSFNDRPVDAVFEAYLKAVNPDVVHSFTLHLSCTPILNVMNTYPHIKWVLSTWGSDLYYHQHIPAYKKGIIKVLPRVDCLFTDCKRDVALAQDLGFKGEVLGVFPGGGGYDLNRYEPYIVTPITNRGLILIKGYQGTLGRCINVLKALLLLTNALKDYRIVVFGTDVEVVEFATSNDMFSKFHFEMYDKAQPLPHRSVLELMGQALIYIGNSKSDGMPNTLLEAVVMGAFPIQSNPGGVTAEIIRDGENGLLIEDYENVEAIKLLLLKALSDVQLIEAAFQINQQQIKPQLERSLVTSRVLKAYSSIDYN